MRRNLLFLSVISLFLLLDSFGDLFLMIGITPESLVSCCTTVTDISSRPTRTTPTSILAQSMLRPFKSFFFAHHTPLLDRIYAFELKI